MSEDRAPTQKAALAIILLVFSFSLGFSLFINLPVMDQNFLFADQAVYFALTQSIAHDLHLEYTRKDLARYYHDFDAGPQGIFLKKARNGKIFFAKSWAYSLFAAPFVRLFGTNGFYVFHSFLLLIVMLLGYTYFSRANSPLASISYLLSFLLASVAGVLPSKRPKRRFCTARFKSAVLDKYQETPCFVFIGYASDESERAVISSSKGREYRWPLIEADMTRQECIDYIKSKGYDVPMKSGCYICPFQKARDYRELRKKHPELFCRVQKIEAEKNKRITRDGRPWKKYFLAGNAPLSEIERQHMVFVQDEYPRVCAGYRWPEMLFQEFDDLIKRVFLFMGSDVPTDAQKREWFEDVKRIPTGAIRGIWENLQPKQSM